MLAGKCGTRSAECGVGARAYHSAFRIPHSALLALFAACATVQDPPGGPPDLAPPVLLSTTPDSGSVHSELSRPAVFQFNEVISERPGATLDQLIIVSPRATAVGVSWKRDAIEVRPRGGWRANVPYQLTLLPGITDLRNNKLLGGRTVVFSTGGGIPATRATGRVIDWEASGATRGALVELTRTSDSLVFWGLADSTGTFTINAVPPGPYVLSGTSDKNSNRRRDYREPFDSALVTLDSTLSLVLWAFVHDSVGPRIRAAQRSDSFAIRLEFTQPIATGGPPAGAIRVRALPDSTPLTVSAIQTVAAHDSARTRKPADDTTRPPPPSPGAIGVAPTLPPGPSRAPAGPSGPAAPPDSALIKLLATRPKLTSVWIVTVGEPVRAGGRYIIDAVVPNQSGATGESTTVLIVPADPVRRDSTRTDSTPPIRPVRP